MSIFILYIIIIIIIIIIYLYIYMRASVRRKKKHYKPRDGYSGKIWFTNKLFFYRRRAFASQLFVHSFLCLCILEILMVNEGNCLPKMDLLRSEPMQLAQLIIPIESAHRAISYLGDLGLFQFKDVRFLFISHCSCFRFLCCEFWNLHCRYSFDALTHYFQLCFDAFISLHLIYFLHWQLFVWIYSPAQCR